MTFTQQQQHTLLYYFHLAMGTMGTLAVGIQSWLKFGKATISFAAGGTQRAAKMSTNSEMANLANTQMTKVFSLTVP